MSDESHLRPRVFIGSSREGHSVAEAIQQNLDYACEVTIWSQGVFGLGEGTLESLVDRLESFDFAVLVLTPDDVTVSRDQTQQSPRDNVLLELGMFLGALGRQRSFIVFDRSKNLKLPSDVAGVTTATFHLHSDGNLQASLGAATSQIKSAIQQHNRRRPKISAEVDETTQFQILHALLDKAPEQFIIWMHESKQKIRRENRFYGGGIRYVYGMRDRSGGQGAFSMDDLCIKLADANLLTVDLRNEVGLTPRGQQYAQWLMDNGHKAVYFRSDIAEWGQPGNDELPWPPQWPMAATSYQSPQIDSQLSSGTSQQGPHPQKKAAKKGGQLGIKSQRKKKTL